MANGKNGWILKTVVSVLCFTVLGMISFNRATIATNEKDSEDRDKTIVTTLHKAQLETRDMFTQLRKEMNEDNKKIMEKLNEKGD